MVPNVYRGHSSPGDIGLSRFWIEALWAQLCSAFSEAFLVNQKWVAFERTLKKLSQNYENPFFFSEVTGNLNLSSE